MTATKPVMATGQPTALGPAVRSATARLALAGVPSPRHDAEVLAAEVLDMPRSQLARVDRLSAGQAQAYDTLITRRADREPLQHLTGRAAFRHLELSVGPGVFLPRPETEVMLDWCLPQLPSVAVAADLGAGSGAIALALATEAPDTTVYAVERDPAAYAWLQRNALGTAVRCVHADIADLVATVPALAGALDLVVSNPPYIPLGTQPLEAEVARYDPAVALWGGRDGLDMVRAVEQVARRLLRGGGRLAIEHADTQGVAVPALLAAAGGWAEIADHRDLADRDRFTTAVWSG